MKEKFFYFLFSLLPLSLCALPVGEKVKAGSAHFSKQESTLQIEASDKTIIDFESFHIQNGEKVLFVQPKSSSALLSRVQGNDPSQILGTLSSNGKVFLVNPHGVYFGQDAIVDTGSLIVSTLDVLNEDFLQERYCFFSKPGQQLGEIRNEGILTALEGSVALIGPRIANEGVILADVGRVLLASAEKVTLDFSGDGMMAFAVDSMMTAEDLQNKVVLDQSATQKIIQGVINTDGFIAASALVENEGIISLVPSSHIAAQDIALTGINIQLEGSLIASQGLYVEAQEILCVRDSMESPLVLRAHQQMTLNAPVIDILALEHPGTQIVSGGDMVLLSNNPISADAHFFAGGHFSLQTLEGTPGDFISFFDPIIRSNESVSFGNYSGTSLKVQAGGNITCSGTINITGVDSAACTDCPGDTDCNTLQTSKALILIAGVTPSTMCTQVPPNQTAGGATFAGSAGTGSAITLSGDITGIDTATFTGNVEFTQNISIAGSGNGNITFNGLVDTSLPSGGYVLTVNAGAGEVIFKEAIGSVNILGGLNVTGTGGIFIGANITTSQNLGMNFNGPIQIIADVVITPGGAVTFNGTLDSSPMDGPWSLEVISDSHTVTFEDNVGIIFPFESLSVHGFFNLNTSAIAVEANTIDFSSVAAGSSLEVGNLSAESGGIILQSVNPITINRNLSSIRGAIVVESPAILSNSIMITTLGTLNFSSLTGTGQETLVLDSGGTSTLGRLSSLGTVFDYSMGGIQLNGAISVEELVLYAQDSIGNLGSPQTITVIGPSIFNTLTGTLGTLLSPLAVDSSSNVIAGAPHQLASFFGTTADGTIQAYSGNVPCPLIFNGVQIPTSGCTPPPLPPPPPPPPPPPLSSGAASIYTGTDSSPISIVAGGSGNVFLTSGNGSSRITQILAADANVSIQAGGNIELTSTQTYTLIQSATDLVMESSNGDIVLQGGSVSGSYVLATTTGGGDISLSASNGSITCTGGSVFVGSSEVNISTQQGGNINLQGQNLYLLEGSGLDAGVTVRTGTDVGVGNIEASFTQLIEVNHSEMATGFGGGNISLMSGGDIDLVGATISATLPSGGETISMSAGRNIAISEGSKIIMYGGASSLIQFVVDANNPMSVGNGGFSYELGSFITNDNKGFVRIYTASRMNNDVEFHANINGLSYVPSTPPGSDTNNEVWNTFYPTVPVPPPAEDGSDHYTIYYKSVGN